MTQRLTPERLAELERFSALGAIRELLDEVHALRAELAGAEERGRAAEFSDVRGAVEAFLTVCVAMGSVGSSTAYRLMQVIGDGPTFNTEAKGTGTTPPDAGESQP